MPPVKPFSRGEIEKISQILCDSAGGLTGSEITGLLSECGIDDLDPKGTKWRRLAQSLQHRQSTHNAGNCVLQFVQLAMEPVRYAGKRQVFDQLKTDLNVVLSFNGAMLDDSGQIRRAAKASSLGEAEERAGRLRTALEQRGVHPEVLRFCRAELVNDNYFHAVLEATKSIYERLRVMTGSDRDGTGLINATLGPEGPAQPLVAINALRTGSDRSEQRGVAELTRGLTSAFRNPTAHSPKIEWNLDEIDALDMLSIASFVHRKLDHARLTRR